MARRYEFYVRVAETISHEDPRVSAANEMSFFFYFIVFENSSKVYKSPFVFTVNTKQPCPGYRNTN